MRADMLKNTTAKSQSPAALTRRRFIRTSAAAVSAISIIPRHVLGGSGFMPPSAKINVAIIGCGQQGWANIEALFQHADVQIIAVADPIESHDLDAFKRRNKSGRLPVNERIQQFYSEKNPTCRVADY